MAAMAVKLVDQDHGDEFKNLSEETYRELVKKAKETNSEYVLHDGKWIHIDPAIAEKYEKAIGELTGEDGTIKIPPGSILDIYENLELLEFIDRKYRPLMMFASRTTCRI